MDQRIIDAAVEVFQLGPEHEDELLRFGMNLQDMEDQERQQEPVAWMNQSGEVASQEALDHWSRTGRPAFAAFTIPLYRHPPATRLSEEVRGLSVEQAKDLLRAINAGAWERIDGALRVNAVSQEHVTQCFKDVGIELEPPF